MAKSEDFDTECALPASPSAATNDPWGSSADNSNSQNEFHDSFVQDSQQVSASDSSFERLPDSDSYLASLESKLQRVQKKGGLVKDLQKRREDEMRRFIDQQTELETTIEEPINDNPILRRIAPERQALTEEEKVALVKADSLQTKEGEEEDSQSEK